jgi:hypothetical protein
LNDRKIEMITAGIPAWRGRSAAANAVRGVKGW